MKPARVPFQYELPHDAIRLILSEIHKSTGYNFQDYAMATVQRRLQRRLINERMTDAAELLDQLYKSPQYAYKLIGDFSINVTEMFRDPQFFNYFRMYVIPELKKESFVRVWIAGCATGEEAYSLAILLHEEGLYESCRIYATDMNEHVISQAKTGVIPLSKMQAYTRNYFASGGKEQFHSYFSFKDEHVYLHPELLKNIVFSHHNLVDDRSFNEFHVIFCRNVLIYFNHPLQERVYDLLYESLAIDGYLGLGNRESLRFTKYASKFVNTSCLQKIYKRID